MTIITKLTEKDFEEILSRYDIGKYKSHRHIAHALQNTVFILNTIKGKFVLKIFEKAEVDFIKFQIKIINYLHRNKIPVAKILKLKNGRNFLLYNGKLVAIQNFIEGDPVKKLNENLAKNLAKNLALMNKCLLRLKLKGRFAWDKDHQFRKGRDIKNIKGVDFPSYEKNLLKEIKKLNRNKLRRSVIHSDFHDANLLVKGNKLKVIIDWDDVHEDYISYEIAVYLMSYIEPVSIEKNKKYIKLFFKEYQKYIELNEDEKKAVYYFMKQRLLGVIFWFEKQKKNHRNIEKKIDRTMNRLVKNYLALERVGLDEFMGLVS